MCWRNKEKSVIIANKDVPVFKICNVEKNTDKVHPYFQTQRIEYKENEEYECSRRGFAFKNNISYGMPDGFMVDRGMHSYSPANLRLFPDDITSIYVGTYKTTTLSHDVIARPQYYRTENTAIMLCVIPKGTRYAVNSVGEIVSDSIKVVKIYIRPFTYNKDCSVSKRSVERVNKVLDNWEIGKLTYVLERKNRK